MSPKADGGADESAGEPRLIVANLGWEEELAGGTRPGERALSRRARSVVASAAGRLRLLARDGDRLWVPDAEGSEEVVPEPVPGLRLPRVRLETGRVSAIAPATEVLAWGESPAVAALRRGSRPSGGTSANHGPLHEALWSLPPAPPEVAAACHHRAFALAASEALQEARPREEGWALPGARMVASVGELERHLAAGGAAAGGGRWVVKSPWSAAGRGRHLGTGPGDLREPVVRRRVERLLERHGSLLFEPWVERLADFGAAALVTPVGLRWVGVHGQEVDGRGVFAAIRLGPELPSRRAPAPGGGRRVGGGAPEGRRLPGALRHRRVPVPGAGRPGSLPPPLRGQRPDDLRPPRPPPRRLRAGGERSGSGRAARSQCIAAA